MKPPNKHFTIQEVRILDTFSLCLNHAYHHRSPINTLHCTGAEWAAGPDQWVAFPWAMLWVAIIARHWSALTWYAILRSAFHFVVSCGPFYWRYIIGKEQYTKYRNFFVSAALISYVLHPGGGLYRDAVMLNAAEHTGLDAINLFVRLLIGSRTLFWLLLVFGYELPPLVGIPLNAICLLVMGRLRPSQPFCHTMQTPATKLIFHTIAANLPLISTISLEHPQLDAEADVCNPLIHWIQATLGFLLPACVHLAGDYTARLAFSRMRGNSLNPRDRYAWHRRQQSAFSPWPVAAMFYFSASSALWYGLMWRQMLPLQPRTSTGTGAMGNSVIPGFSAVEGS